MLYATTALSGCCQTELSSIDLLCSTSSGNLISTAVRPHNTINNLLAHPKDKRKANQMCEVVYDISCKGCDKSCIGETGRAFGTRLKEHRVMQTREQTGNSPQPRKGVVFRPQ